MGKFNAISVITALLLLAITAYLVYAVVSDYRSFREVSQLSEEFYKEDVAPAELDSKIAVVRQHLEASPSPPLRLLLFDMLLFKAFYYPDECSEPLSEALEIGQELYRTLDSTQGPVGAQLAFGYLYAGLPTRLPSWLNEVAARDPQYRAQLSLLTFFGYVTSDNLEAAQTLVDEEADAFGQHLQTRAMAAAAYHALGLEHESRQFALEEGRLEYLSSSIRLAYAGFLLERGDYIAAEKLLRSNLEEMSGDPGRSFELALCLTVTRDIDDAEVQRLLTTAAGSTRDPMSHAGAEALCLAGAYQLEGNTEHAERLLNVAGQFPDDFHVLEATAQLALELAQNEVDLDTAFPGEEARATGIADPVGLGWRLVGAAKTPVEVQDAYLLLALALTVSAQGQADPRGVLEQSAEAFSTALGVGDGEAVPETDRIPDYELFLLEPDVREMRKVSPDFDQAIHRAVVDLLNKRREMFADVVKLPAIEYER